MAKSSNELKLARLQMKARKQELEYSLLRQAIASPLVQMIGTVAVTEALEYAGILSGRWAGAIEGGVITMVGLQALKDYGVIGAGTLGLGMGVGSLLGMGQEGGSDFDRGVKAGFLQSIPGYNALSSII